MMKYLFLDDERIPKDVTWINNDKIKDYHNIQWNIVRSYKEAVKWVKNNGFPDVISFDHDLGYEKVITSQSGILVVTDSTESKSGYDFARWLIDYDMDTDSMPKDFTFIAHSQNPIGAENIKRLLWNYIAFKRK